MKASTRNALACTMAFAFATPLVSAVQIFHEGFDLSPAGCNTNDFPNGAGTYPFPTGWLLRNVDNGTPDASVAYVNEAWEVREDFGQDVTNCVAFSTSWYSPPGVANDWMWTPAIALPVGTNVLAWRARVYDPAYPDGYEVRVMISPNTPTGGAGVIGNQITNSVLVFSVAAEQSAWTAHSVSLAAFSGQTVYVGFRNNSNDKFLLVVDDVTVLDSTPDVLALPSTPFATAYSRAPAGFIVDAVLGFSAYNAGGIDLTSVIGSAQYLLNGSPNGTPLQATTIASLAMGTSAPAVFPGAHVFTGAGTWSVQYNVSAMESASEVNTANNVLTVPGVTIGGNEFARAEGVVTGTLGIGAGNGGELGEQFTLLADATIAGIRFGMLPQGGMIDDGMGGTIPNPFIGAPLVANLRAYDDTTPPGKPGALIATTVPVAATTQGGVYDVAFSTGPHLLTAGTYVVTVSEPVQAQAMSVPLHTDRFVPGTVWVNWPTAPTGDWAHVETFGTAYAKTPEVSMLVELSIFKDGFGLSGVNRPSNGVQAWREPLPLAPTPRMRKPASTQLSTKS